MTSDEMALARFLLRTLEDAQEQADRLDPTRDYPAMTVLEHLDFISRQAREAFIALTERGPTEVNFHDFNSETPSAWAKSYHPRKSHYRSHR